MKRVSGKLKVFRDSQLYDVDRDYKPDWTVDGSDSRFVWLKDRGKGVVLLDKQDCQFELRCHGPGSHCPDAVIPKHYHTPAYQGIRVIYCWRVKALGLNEVDKTVSVDVQENGIQFICRQSFDDGSRTQSTCVLGYDSEWGAYVVEVRSQIQARKINRSLEYCNLLPAGIGDSREEFERFPYTVWSNREGVMKMGKNPLWFNSVESQDIYDAKQIVDGGFLGFGPDRDFNPFFELISSSPGSGAMTCDNLQDEHIMAIPPMAQQAKSGWYSLEAHFRIFSVQQALAEAVVADAKDLMPKTFLAWKYQYPAIPELPDDLTHAELPGSVFYGKSDWSQPVSWHEPFNGNLWTASPDPRANIHWDREVGKSRPGSIRLRVEDESLFFSPGTGHTLHLREGKRYRASIWIRTEGDADGWLDAREMLFTPWQNTINNETSRASGSEWEHKEVEFVAKGEDYPFAALFINASGTGQVWFSDLAFEELT